jgi:hypothetical protein
MINKKIISSLMIINKKYLIVARIFLYKINLNIIFIGAWLIEKVLLLGKAFLRQKVMMSVLWNKDSFKITLFPIRIYRINKILKF